MSSRQKTKKAAANQQNAVIPAEQENKAQAAMPADAEGSAGAGTPAKRRRIKKLHEITAADDIRYRGPLSYQGFQALGWVCIIASVLRLILAIGGSRDPKLHEDTKALMEVLAYMAPLPLPFLLIANFSRILNNSEGFKKQLLRNGLAAAAIFAASSLFFSRYVVGLLSQAVKQPEQVRPLMNEFFAKYNQQGFVAFNLFIDLFLCTLTMLFLNAHPKRVFTGRKVIILRLFTLLPIAYEAASIWLKLQSALGNIVLPFWTFPLLTVKPPMTFFLFLFLSVHMGGREIRFRRNGRSHEEYLEYLQTNRNSLHFSLCLVAAMLIATALDFLLLGGVTQLIANAVGAQENTEEYVKCLLAAKAVGFGCSWPLFFAAPLVLLYSYNREPKNKIISLLIPVVSIVIIILLVLESVYQGVGVLLPADKKIDIDMLRMLLPRITQMLTK